MERIPMFGTLKTQEPVRNDDDDDDDDDDERIQTVAREEETTSLEISAPTKPVPKEN